MLPTLTTPRLTLRALKASDRADLFAVYGDARTMAFAADPVFTEPAMVDQLLSSVARLHLLGVSLEWGLEERASGRLIGTCGLHSFNAEGNAAEFGCLLGSPYWRQGLMSEALAAMVAHARAQGLRQLLADVDDQNPRAIAFFQSRGFVREPSGLFRLTLA
ncbi:GNAT family N-acetyltransferase [Gallaecimonas sp. GXIMD4217]|uniref:GNAT family N-acetyltransferase n=1 Tax=Gallaecimonas sp. GXIMD4217 TaxID=3131927 RepID=UPI00311B2437